MPDAAAEQAVDDLVDGAVAAEDDDQVERLLDGLGAELDRVAAVRGLGEVDLQVAAEGAGEDVALARVVAVALGLTTNIARIARAYRAAAGSVTTGRMSPERVLATLASHGTSPP